MAIHTGRCPLTGKSVLNGQCFGCDGCDQDETLHMATAGTVFPSLTWMDRADMDPRELVRMGLDVPCIDQLDFPLDETDDGILCDGRPDGWDFEIPDPYDDIIGLGDDPIAQLQRMQAEFPDKIALTFYSDYSDEELIDILFCD